jgi:hypothetical protein
MPLKAVKISIKLLNCVSPPQVICGIVLFILEQEVLLQYALLSQTIYRAVWYAGCIPDSHPHRITSTKCHKNTIVSPGDGPIVARNM